MYGQVCEHFTIERHLGPLEPVHELAVGKAVQAGRGVDADDPETSKLALALAAGLGAALGRYALGRRNAGRRKLRTAKR